MQQQEGLQAEIGLEQRSGLLKAWTDFKDSIFNVLFVILDRKSGDEEEESLFGLIMESGLDYLQIMAFPFHQIVIGAWNGGDSLNSLTNFFGQFNIGSYLPGAPFSAFLAMLYFLILIIMLIVVDIVYVSYSFSRKKFRFTFPLIILAQVVPLFVTVLFLPITETLLSVVQCQQDDTATWYMTSFPDVACWTGWHLFHATITLLFVTLFVVISSIVALALFEPRMTTHRLTARQNSNGEVVFIINKIVLQFFFSFKPFGGSAFYVAILFLLALWQFYCYCIHQPYYSPTATKFFKICATYYFWTALMLFVGQILGPYGFDGALVLWISGLPFFALVILFEGTSQTGALFTATLKFKTGTQLQEHLASVLQLVERQTKDRSSLMLLIGYIQKHKEMCNETDCPLKSSGKNRGEDSMAHSCQQVLKQVHRMFKAGIKKFPDCTKLRMSHAFFQLQQLKNKEAAYEEFTEAGKLDPSFQQQFNIYRFKKIIRQNLEEGDENDADLVETIRFENHVSLLEEAMLLSAKLHKQFWTELKEEIPDLKRLNTVGAQITETGNTITQNYSQISGMNSAHCQVLYAYAHYLILVNQDFTEGKQLLDNAKKIYQDRESGQRESDNMVYDEASLDKAIEPLLFIEGCIDDDAKIINTNLMFTEVTGYQKEEMIGEPMSLLSPQLYKNANGAPCLPVSHEDPGNEEQGVIRHKFGHILSVDYTIAEQRDAKKQITLKLSPHNSSRIIFLVSDQGVITDANLLGQQTLAQMDEKVTKISEIGLSNFKQAKFKKAGTVHPVDLGIRKGECLVQTERLIHKITTSEEIEDEGVGLVDLCRSYPIGWKVCISRYEKGGMLIEDTNKMTTSRSIENHGEGEIDQGLLQLYDNPDPMDIYISNLAETKHLETVTKRFELKEKIRTMRLVNNEIKMVYNQGGENDFVGDDPVPEAEDEREMFKFDDEGYQAKLRSAINTNLNHIEVVNLRRASVICLLLLFAVNGLELWIEGGQVGKITSWAEQVTQRSEEYSRLSSNIMASLNSTNRNYPALYTATHDHDITFNAETSVEMVLENNLTLIRNLRDAVILLQSRLLNHFQDQSPQPLNTVYSNYILSLYDGFLNYPTGISIKQWISIVLASLAGVTAIVMMLYWVYISLLIDKKRYDIMIWFLDIPIPYVAHLGAHCDKYLKEYITVKELSRRGIAVDDDSGDFDSYNSKKHTTDEDQIEEQIKARKSLISKNKKQTLISRVSLSSLTVLWVLVYAMFFSTLLLVLTSQFYNNYNFLRGQWLQTERTIITDSTLYVAMELNERNYLPNNDLPALINELQLSHKDAISRYGLETFNYQIQRFYLELVSKAYLNVYFGDICDTLKLTGASLAQCQTVIYGKLRSGYEIYSKYLINIEADKAEQVRIATELYSIPGLLQMMREWEESMVEEGSSVVSLCSIMLYVFIILSIICFLLLWLYYLRRLNTELNQTIQMLNMIPFKLLPKSRKETKVFIAWIIREANKTKHEES